MMERSAVWAVAILLLVEPTEAQGNDGEMIDNFRQQLSWLLASHQESDLCTPLPTNSL